MAGWLGGLGSTLAKKLKNLWSSGQPKGLDAHQAQALEEILIEADLGVKFSAQLVKTLQQQSSEPLSFQQALERLEHLIFLQLQPYCRKLTPLTGQHPWVVLCVGANGSGKTTTLAKLAHRLRVHHPLRLIAGDTFRAAATEQLQVWGQRLGVPVYGGARGADAASVIFQHVKTARPDEVVLVDTAGRLPTQANLMNEGMKIKRVLGKLFPECPQETLAILDGTSGQNLRVQAALFHKALSLTGLIVTKLDGGDALKGGGLLGAVEDTGVPLVAIGHGENLEDLEEANPQALAATLVGRADKAF